MLMAVVKIDPIISTKLNLNSEEATSSVIAYCGRPDMVLQLHQVLCKKARFNCMRQAGFKSMLHKHVNDANTSDRTLKFYSELVPMRYKGELN